MKRPPTPFVETVLGRISKPHNRMNSRRMLVSGAGSALMGRPSGGFLRICTCFLQENSSIYGSWGDSAPTEGLWDEEHGVEGASRETAGWETQGDSAHARSYPRAGQ